MDRAPLDKVSKLFACVCRDVSVLERGRAFAVPKNLRHLHPLRTFKAPLFDTVLRCKVHEMLVASGKMSLEQVERDEFTQVHTAFAGKVKCNIIGASFLDW